MLGIHESHPHMTISPRASGSLAIGCFAVVLAAIVSLHLLRPDFDPVTHRLSEYAIGPYGYLMTAAFLFACLGLLALGHTVWHTVRHSFWTGVACGAMIAAAVADGLMAFFVADPYGPNAAGLVVVTTSGRMHDLLALSHAFFWSLAVGATPFALLADPKWRRFAFVSFGAGALVAAGMAVRTFSGMVMLGLTQRVWIAGVLLWSLTHALKLRDGTA
jgi:hypothetical protein